MVTLSYLPLDSGPFTAAMIVLLPLSLGAIISIILLKVRRKSTFTLAIYTIT